MNFEEEQFIRELDGIRERFFEMIQKCEAYEAAIEAPDRWAIPEVEVDDGSYHYIPYQLDGVVELLLELAKILPDDPDFRHSHQPIRPLSLVEVGCGIGRNLNLFTHQQIIPLTKAVGFDIVPEYVETAKTLYGLGEEVFVQDAMTFDYKGFDIIFFYRPFSDEKLEAEFEEYLLEHTKPGAIIIGLNVERLDSSRMVASVGRSGSCYKRL